MPLGTLALMSNLGALVCGTWFPWATELFNNAAWFFMSAMTDVSEWSTKIPGAFFYVPAPSWWTIGIYYAVIIGALSGWLFVAEPANLERDGFDFDRRHLFLAAGKNRATKPN